MTPPDEPVDPAGAPTPQWYNGEGSEHTQPLPFVEAQSEPTKPFFSRRAGVLATIAVAFIVGGAAGVGGATWANAWSKQSNEPAAPTAVSSTAALDGVAPTSNIEQVAAKVLPSVVEIKVSGSTESGSGSGIILSSDGMILTNNHVVVVAANGGTISVSMNDGRLYPAKLVGTDPVTDSAVIQVQGLTGLTPATLGHSSTLKVGQTVLAIGSPFGLSSTVTQGIVSALNRPVQVNEAAG
ncbi:MAG TPA: trypsin-like peptidase domain-containing protein, partial [Marmoricola sp.]|nr:trypsin-like peptidase domain-containing protein [Marmoricola sp.]